MLAEKLEEMAMSVKEFAVRTSKPEKTIFAVINGSSSITSDMAVAFESVTKIPAHFWLNKQRSYDEYVSRKKREATIAESTQWAEKFPIEEMTRLGWIESADTPEDKVSSMLSFFQVSTVKGWEDYYCNQQLKVAFRISLSKTKNPYAMSAWIRQGEIQAAQAMVSKYSRKALKAQLPALMSLVREQPSDFAEQLQALCAKAGVKLLYTPALSQIPVNGCVRWINDTPCIQLADNQKRNDIFWFTFFHEVGHLRHGKKDVFLENIDYGDKEAEKEKEADEFAARMLLSPSQEKQIIDNADFTEPAIKRYAAKFKVHPSIIIGRLQHRRLVPKEAFAEYFTTVELCKDLN